MTTTQLLDIIVALILHRIKYQNVLNKRGNNMKNIEDKEENIVIQLPALSKENLGIKYIITKDGFEVNVTVEASKSHEMIECDGAECCYREDYANRSISAFCTECNYVSCQDTRGWNYCPHCGITIKSKMV